MKLKKILRFLLIVAAVVPVLFVAFIAVTNYVQAKSPYSQGEWGKTEVFFISKAGPISEDGTEFTPVIGVKFQYENVVGMDECRETKEFPNPVEVSVATDNRGNRWYFTIQRATVYKEMPWPWEQTAVSQAKKYVFYQPKFEGEPPDFQIGVPLKETLY